MGTVERIDTLGKMANKYFEKIHFLVMGIFLLSVIRSKTAFGKPSSPDCKNGYSGEKCEICSEGWYRPENKTENECTYCGCNPDGSEGKCDQTGQCQCKIGFEGKMCNECKDGFAGRNCGECKCNENGAASRICNKSDGKCQCKDGFKGHKCNSCSLGFHLQFSSDKFTCENCNCDVIGSKYNFCLPSGQCECKKGYSGEKCEKCAKQFYRPGNK